MSYKGDVFIIIGVLLIILSFILGYGMYTSLHQAQITQQTPQINGNNITNSFNQFASSLSYSINGPIYYAIEIILLFLFASIGYKIADLGIRLNSVPVINIKNNMSDEKDKKISK